MDRVGAWRTDEEIMRIHNLLYLIVFIITGYQLTPTLSDEVSSNDTSSSSYHVCADGLIVPAWKPQHNLTSWDRTFRGFVYFIALLYLFLGVSIISDRSKNGKNVFFCIVKPNEWKNNTVFCKTNACILKLREFPTEKLFGLF
uniref:Uncharacterized protein n=1 Tax=Rhodnius prolixus TaxID=13249 RepID=T1HXZ7_RHOPR